ncbi:hypothetical protein HYT25_01520, partial [Candidatus Pacearchaeota archaeon]|nr:hypothetical protein [Candidatus Pacearchaeota archaeon]
KVFHVGKERIVFIKSRLNEIKEAITKQDIRDLKNDGAILIRGIKGRKTAKKRARKRFVGKIKKRVNKRKKIYMVLTRKLRQYIEILKAQGKLPVEEYRDLRKKVRNSFFRSKAHLKEYLEEK